jgi:HKD family nuclease
VSTASFSLFSPRVTNRFLRFTLIVCAAVAIDSGVSTPAHAAETLCDSSFQNCRTPLLALIDAETVEIDVGFWFMEDQRYVSHIIARKNAGVAVRLIVDPRANPTYPLNKTSLDAFQSAGIPMIKKTSGGIMHWKAMIFAGQNTVEFGSANYSVDAFVPVTPYVNYVSETIFFEDDPAIVNSFKRKFDDLWVDTTNYSVYANAPSRVRTYPQFTISADLNLPPGQSYTSRLVGREKAETVKIDVDMYRITQQAHSDALIAAHNRGVPVRYMGETREYRDPTRLWVAWNMDRMFAAGIPMRVRQSAGENHEKLVLLYGQGMTVFGSSNFTSPSDNSQQEHNYFTIKAPIFQWFEDQFNRKWNNSTGNAETTAFVPLPPDAPAFRTPANAATGVATSGQSLVWYGGPFAHTYDIYFGTDPTASALLAANQALGPSQSTTQTQSIALPTLQPGTTYYWKIVSKTAANLTKSGPVWSFTTGGAAPPPPPPPAGATTIVLWASQVPAANRHGNWISIADSSAAGGAPLENADHGAAKIAPALASPTNYFETTFNALAGTAYHLWVRLRAQNNSFSNDSIHVQFNDSVDGSGTAIMRIGSSGSAEVVLQNGPTGAADQAWGWGDNGWGVIGLNIFFATSGQHTIRVQQREDGAIVDQIVLSPTTYLNSPPGPRQNDATILTANAGP